MDFILQFFNINILFAGVFVSASFFVLQFMLCLYAKAIAVKLTPVYIAAFLVAFLITDAFFLKIGGSDVFALLADGTAIYSSIGLSVSWGAYAVMKYRQKSDKAVGGEEG